ncbi:MAG: hypothetical protein PHX83_05455 [Acidobacteriia bacterium]|nr:hypothetical protein [Terriglobia bacterium]
MWNRLNGFGKFMAVVILAVASIFFAVAIAYCFGTVNVRVDESKPGGNHFAIAVPSAVIPIGMQFVPDQVFKNIDPEVRPYLPAIRAAAEELKKCPDALLVEVRDGKDHVMIRKAGRNIVIDVKSSDGEEVHVSVPVSSLVSVAERMETAQPGS